MFPGQGAPTGRSRVKSARAWLLLGVFSLLVGLAGLCWSWWGAAAPAQSCRERLALLSDDGESLPLDLYRCEPANMPRPALVIWASGHRREKKAWLAELDAWARDGNAIWYLAAEARRDMAVRDLKALVEAVSQDPSTDSGRLALLLAGQPAESIAGGDPWPELPGSVCAALLVERGPKSELEQQATDALPHRAHLHVPRVSGAPKAVYWLEELRRSWRREEDLRRR